ncbi:ABC transporter ATP-binding protein [uncultured Rhodospira sp.]|uniref:ABC transporter ATP-binding protein n=1 Tax=uncultured Rhodospira sp. TaxID=1936189 RepID=UPI002615F264|nr:ABC transporter ATP-binding protein [uncultured Rhodospira sp.]
MNSTASALSLQAIRRAFRQADAPPLTVLDGADLTINAGEIVALVGPSGSGKSTLLQIAGLLEHPDDGEVLLAGQAASGLGDKGRTLMRRRFLGFVYQYHHLLPEFSAEENVIVPQMVAGVRKGSARARARDLLERMGLAARGHHRPGQLSGGEQQRVAIARALANAPKVLLADEPTGNLDPNTADGVFAEFLRLVREEGLAALIATHNPDLARRMDRVVTLRAGKVDGVIR